MGFFSDHPIAVTIAAVVAVWFAKGFINVWHSRRRFKNLPGPPHHPIFGHLISVGKIVPKIPKRVHPHVQPFYMTKEFNLPPVYYMDLWPATDPLLVILHPETAQEVSSTLTGKGWRLNETLKPLAGEDNIVTMDGARWKKWRTVFNPAFSVQHLMSQVPTIVDCADGLITIFDQHVKRNKPFRLEEEATKFTLDIIGIVICDHDFKSLTTENEFVETMRKTLTWMPDTQSIDPFHKNHPLRPLYWKYYKRQMDNYIGRVLDERFAVRDASLSKKSRKKVGIDLALEEYFKEHGQDVDAQNVTMDAEFRRYAIDNLLALLFAGHDTTASTICYCYHLLNQHPDKLAKIRKELDAVFGEGVGAGDQLRKDPYLINKCDYTVAVIRETLRLWPPASTIRKGRPDYFVKDPVTGDMLPTDGVTIWIPSMAMHRDTRFWGETASQFMPERFLPGNVDAQMPHAYRPFEKGPRNCIGQELALLELKLVLAMTVREFDIQAAYDELDSLEGDGSMWTQTRTPKDGLQEVFGDPMYQVLLAAAKPRDGMPARISRTTMKVSR